MTLTLVVKKVLMESENEKLIRAFLFGEMAEVERSEFEAKFIADEDLFEEIKVVEDELIEKYVRGWMKAAEKAKFGQNFLTTKKRRERVEFSRQLIGKLEAQKDVLAVRENAENISSPETFWDKFAALFLSPKIALAGALALIIAVFGSWFLYKNLDGNSEFVKNENNRNSEIFTELKTPTPAVSPVESTENNQNNAENVDLESSINSQDNSQKQPTNLNGNLNKTINKEREKPTPTSTPVQKTAPNPVLALFAGTVRSGGKNNVLNLPENADGAVLQLNLENVDYKSYNAQLSDENGNIVFQRSNLPPKKSRLNFYVPAQKLKRGDYIIKIFGKNDSDEPESAADFQFRVQ